MDVRFTWRPGEWKEAYLLAHAAEDRSGGPVPMGYALLGITAAGGAGDLARAMGRNRHALLHDSLAPMLLLVVALFAVVLASMGWLRRRERLRGLPAVPPGEQQVTVHETGWAAASVQASPRQTMRSWAELRGQRTGRRVLTLLTEDGSTVGVPLRALTPDQGGWLERLLQRKVPHLA